MKTAVSKRGVSLLQVPVVAWEAKIGYEQASSTVKGGFGTAKWLAYPTLGKLVRRTAKNSLFHREQQIK
jgi:hypothetical protein